MSIFGIIKSDDQVFTGDKIRIDVSGSFLAPGLSFATVSHEVSTDGGTTWYNVTAKKSVDWIFTTAGVKTISLRVSTTEPGSAITTKTVTVLNLATQGLFSNDSDLYQQEPEIDEYLPKKWSSWNLVHLSSQKWIMDLLDEKGIFDQDGNKYVVADVLDVEQVRQLSIYKTLETIYEGNSKIVGDLFSIKRDKYRELANTKASRSNLVLDYNKNEAADEGEKTDLHSVVLRRY
jgi:hypothetical protein